MIKTLAQEFNLGKEKVKEMAGVNLGAYREGGIISPFDTLQGSGLKRVAKDKLEQVYFENSVIRNSIRRKVQMIGSAGYRIKYNDDNEKKIFEEFFKDMGQIGDDCDFDEIYVNIPKNQFIFGAGWNELIWDEKDEEIVDLQRFDPKKMDYARNANREIILNPLTQKSIGYTMKVPSLSRDQINSLGDELPSEYKKLVHLDGQIFLLPKRVALIRLEEEGDGLEFWGLIETIYRDAIRKGKLEEAGFNSAFQRWMSPLIGYIGDDKHPPTPALAKQTLEHMQKMKHDMLTTLPYFTKLENLKGNEMDSYIEMLKSLRENEASGLQMPMPFAMSGGEATNRATLNNQQAMLEFGLNELVKLNAKQITKRIFKPIALSKGLNTWPVLIANRVSVDEIDDRAIRFGNYVARKIFSPEEVRPILAEVEGIELIKLPEEDSVSKNEEESKDSEEKSDNEDLSDKIYEEPYDFIKNV